MKDQTGFELAFELHLAGSYPEAVQAYQTVLSINPAHVEANHYLGVLMHQMGKTDDAILLIKHALALEPQSAGRYNDLGNILSQIGDLDNAVDAFRHSLALNTVDANVWNNLASIFHRQKDFTGAESAYRQALLKDPVFVPAMNNLANLLAETGREQESAVLFCQAYIQPPLTDKSLRILGYAYYSLGRLEEAAECYRNWLAAEPDNAFAQHHLAACTGINVPLRASDRYIAEYFDDMAEHFEEKLVGKLLYSGPEIIVGLLDKQLSANHHLIVLDAGCGTGLCGPVLTKYSAHLTGVDISPGMLNKAKEKKCYDDLLVVELSHYLSSKKSCFDLVVMADTLIYFGKLDDVFELVRQALRKGGFFAFTVETNSEPDALTADYQLTANGRYVHSYAYLQKLLSALCFDVLTMEKVVVRMEIGEPTNGYAALIRLP